MSAQSMTKWIPVQYLFSIMAPSVALRDDDIRMSYRSLVSVCLSVCLFVCLSVCLSVSIKHFLIFVLPISGYLKQLN